jgi:hypothetical protein
MSRITISLPSSVAAALQREAQRRRLPVSQVAREAIETNLGLTDETYQEPAFIGLWDRMGLGPVPPMSDRVDELLAETWAQDINDDAFSGDR